MKRNFWYGSIIAAAVLIFLSGCTGAQEQESIPQKEGEMGRYVETSLAAPGDHGSIGALRELADGKIAFLDNVDGLFLSDDGAKNFERAQEQMESLINFVDGERVALSPDGHILYGKKRQGGGFSLQTRTDEGGVQVCLEGEGSLGQLAFGPDGMLYAAVSRDSVHELLKINPLDWKAQPWIQTAQEPVSIAFLEGKIYAAQAGGVELFDADSGAPLEEDPVLSEFAKGHLQDVYRPANGSAFCLFSGKDGVLYAACREGLYRHVPGGSLMEQLIDGKNSWFGKADAAIWGILEISEHEFLALFAGGNLVRFSYDGEVPAKPETILRVYSLKKDRNIQQAVELFEKEHPQVDVFYEVGMTADSQMTKEDALKNLNTLLLAKDGPDVIFLDGLDAQIYREKGMLTDLTGVLEKISGQEELLTAVAAGQETEGKHYVLSARFMAPVLMGKKTEIEGVHSLEDLADRLAQIRARVPEGSLLETYGPEWTLRLLAVNSAQTWSAEEKKLNPEALTEFLVQAKKIYETEAAGLTQEEQQEKEAEEKKMYRSGFAGGNGSYRYTIEEWSLYPALKGEMFLNGEGILMGLLRNVEDFAGTAGFINLRPEYEMRLMPGQTENILLKTQQMAVSSQSGQKELAFAFVESMFGEKVQKLWSQNGFPVNLSVLGKQLQGGEENYSSGLHGVNRQGEEISLDIYMPKEAVREAFLTEIQAASGADWPKEVILDTVSGYGKHVLEGKISVEQGAADIEKKLAIYLAE